jgi:glutamate dehydrogenase (NAD(P)+)
MNAAGCDFQGMSDSSYFTALTVVSAMKAACEMRGISIANASVIIEGFGKVGMHIASELEKLGCKIVGISTIKGAIYNASGLDIDRVMKLQNQYEDDLVHHYGVECITKKELLLEKSTDVLIPCARTWSINRANMNNINAKMIIPGANVPLTKEAEEFLHQKGILCLPDFLCNVGGVFGTSLYDNGNSIPTVHHFIMNDFGRLVKEVIWKSTTEHRPPSEIARVIAKKNGHMNDEETRQKLWRKFVVKWPHRLILIQRFIPGVKAWFSLQDQRRIFAENCKDIKSIY